MAVTIELPWPPSANTYWRRNGGTYFISAKGIAYRNFTILTCKNIDKTLFSNERLSVTIFAFPPDRRRRDLDNICKCLLDSLQKAEVYKDDSQIDHLVIHRMTELVGTVTVSIACI